jgi:hypothetical protein
MKIDFTEGAVNRVLVKCFMGNERDALEYIGMLVVGRMEANGDSWAYVGGELVQLRVTKSEDGKQLTIGLR